MNISELTPDEFEPKITAFVSCFNEENFVYPCLQQILPLADQTIIWDGDFWIGNVDPGRNDVMTSASQDKSREMIERAISMFGEESKVERAYFEGMPKLAESEARNTCLQMASGDYLLIVDCDEIWQESKFTLLKKLVEANKGACSDYFIRNRLFFWNPYFYVLTKHMRMFKLWPGRRFEGANEVTESTGNVVLPPTFEPLFDHYGYVDPEKVREKMRWYDAGQWRNCGSQWFENIYRRFDGTEQCARELFDRNYGTLHPWGRVHPGFAADEFTPLFAENPTHSAVMRQYFLKMGFDISKIVFME